MGIRPRIRGILAASVAGLALAPAAAPGQEGPTVTVANLNLFTGTACDPPTPADGDQCRIADRMDLLIQHLEAAGCPDLVTLQENVVNEFVQVSATESVGPLESTVALIEARLPALAVACGFAYQVVFDPEGVTPAGAPRGIDEELILTRYPALSAQVTPLYSALAPFFGRQVLQARIDHPGGPIDVYTSHLAAGSTGEDVLCGAQANPALPAPPCPAECDAFSQTARECQARQVALHVEATHQGPNPALVTGDLNAGPGSDVYNEFAGRQWFDAQLAAGNPECDVGTGLGCTAFRDAPGGALEQPERGLFGRIDFIFVVPATAGAPCAGNFEPVPLGGIFAGEPNPFAPSCGPAPDPICWPSDHGGNLAALSCAGEPPPPPPPVHPDILALDATRVTLQRTLPGGSMSVATQVLQDAGFSIANAPRFSASALAGSRPRALYTGHVNQDFTVEELLAVGDFVEAGGGLIIQRDVAEFFPAADPLAAIFGVTYDTTYHPPLQFDLPFPHTVHKMVEHPIWSGPAGSADHYAGFTASAVESGATAIGMIFTGGVGLAVKEVGKGRVVFLTDVVPWTDRPVGGGIEPGNKNAIVWENMFHYAVPEPSAHLLQMLALATVGVLARLRAGGSDGRRIARRLPESTARERRIP